MKRKASTLERKDGRTDLCAAPLALSSGDCSMPVMDGNAACWYHRRVLAGRMHTTEDER